MNISKVLVTGGAGYIGAHVVEVLAQQGFTVVVFDNLSTGRKQHIPKGITLIKGSILNKNALKKAFELHKPDAVIHLAALKAAGESMLKPAAYSETNITGTINVLQTMIEHSVKHFVFSSTAAVYGNPQYLPINENHILIPINYYGATKQIIENILQWYSEIYDFSYTALRYFNAAGHLPSSKLTIIEPNPQNLIPIILEVAKGKRKVLQIFGNDYDTPDGTCLRDYIHVCDLAEAHALSLKYLSENNKSISLNLGTGRGYSVLEIYNAACQITQQSIPMKIISRRPGDIDALYAKSILALKTLQWEPQYTDIKLMIKHAWEAYHN